MPYSYKFHEIAQRRQVDQAKDAILSMMRQVVRLPEYGGVMTPNLNMQRSITYLKVVTELAKASFSDSELDVRGSAFEYFVKTSLKGRRLGQFFTPRQLVRFMLSLLPLEQIILDLLDPESDVRVIDPACGSGGFLLAGMNILLQKVRSERGSTYSQARADYLEQRIKRDVFWGADANQRIASAAKMNMIIAGDGFANIKHRDSLTEQIDFLGIDSVNTPQAEFVVTNPPFGMSEADSLSEEDFNVYELRVTKTQGLFLQKMIRLTRPQGRIFTVIDEGVLNTAQMSRVRKYVIEHCHIDAVVSLPDVTFRPNKINVKSSLLLLSRKRNEDEVQDYPIRMIEMHRMGYTSLGEEDRDVPIEEIINLTKARWEDMQRLSLTLEDTGGLFRSYPLALSNVFAEEEVRLDFKYYDPDTLQLIEDLNSSGAKSIGSITIEAPHRGRSPAKAEYNTDDSNEVLVVKAGNIGHVGLVGEFDTIEDLVYERLDEAHIHDGDLLLASTGDGTLGKAAVYTRPERAITDGHVTIIRLNSQYLPEYVAWYLRSDYGRRQIYRLFTGSTGLIELTEAAVNRTLILAPTDLERQDRLSLEWVTLMNEAAALEVRAQQMREDARRQFSHNLQQSLEPH